LQLEIYTVAEIWAGR